MSSNKNALNWDANACYGISLEHLVELQKIMGHGLNPSSIHSSGQAAKALIESARGDLLNLLGNTDNTRVVFTSGATEANNTVCLAPLWWSLKSEAKHILTSAVEHPSVLEPLKKLEQMGFEVTYLSPEQIMNCSSFVRQDTSLVSIMSANNETGHIYNTANEFKIIKDKFPKVIIHSDAVQLLGKVVFNFSELNADIITISAHKIGGLTGVGGLVFHKKIQLPALLRGGAQELRYRAGTENVVGIASFGMAARNVCQQLYKRIANMENAKRLLVAAIKENVRQAKILFENADTLPNTIALHFNGISADDLVVALDLASINCSSGSACASGKPLPSHVLMAYGLTEKAAKEVIRISITADLTQEELLKGVATLANSVNRLYATNYNEQAA